MSILTRESFRAMRETAEEALRRSSNAVNVLVCAGTGCIAGGSLKVCETLKEECERRGLQVYVGLTEHSGEEKSLHIKMSGCHGFCEMGPLVHIEPLGVMYIHVKPEDCCEIVEKTVMRGEIIERLTYQRDGVSYPRQEDIPFYKKQHRVVLASCGTSDAEDLDEYIAKGGYSAFEKALFTMTPEAICKEISDSGLRGRGGGGFPAGRKWDGARKQKSAKKYIVCNGDEGDPGAFMDRSVLEGDPHVVLEAMTIAGYAIGAHQGYIYVRAEYPIAIHRLQIAIKQAREYGFLGDDIFGTGFAFDIELRLGSGAFVCGEETALMTSIEGHRGEPRPRPPFPAVKGLFGVPTILNNVETWANIPRIILNGADWFASMGTERSKGTKVFCLVGKINNTGLVEIPMGTTLREIVEDIGGGIPNGKKFKAAQTGGPSGGCIPASLIDTPIDYDNLIAIGSMMGSGGLIVMDEDTCMVDIAKFFLEFTVDESCGKCTPCRVGTRRLLEMLEQITAGNGTVELLREMEELCYYIKANSLCALGQSAPNPVLSTLHYFRDEYEAHCIEKRCPAGVCKRLVQFVIEEDKCKGCTACARACPVNAISGEVRKPHQIDTRKCIKCGACMETCRFNAIVKR